MLAFYVLITDEALWYARALSSGWTHAACSGYVGVLFTKQSKPFITVYSFNHHKWVTAFVYDGN
jgi:hypothetical protein